MQKTRLIGLLVAGSILAAGAAVAAGKPALQPGSWIVELTDPPSVEFRGGEPASALALDGPRVGFLEPTAPGVTGADRLDVDAPAVRRYAAYLDDARARVLQRIRSTLGRDVEPKFVYRHLHNGFAAEMSADEAERIADLPGVRAVHPDLVQRVHTDVGPEWIGAPDLWTGASGAPNPSRGEGTVLGVIDTGVNWASVFFDTVASGEPVSNPRGQFYGLCADGTLDVCNAKLIGIYDFTDEGSRGFDPDGHGSHVASTAVGLPLNLTLDFGSGPIQFGTSGVAPRASFIAYKACEEPPDGGGFTCEQSATNAALEQAIVDEVDVTNYSLGLDVSVNPWVETSGVTMRRLRAAGIVPVASAGNAGPEDGTIGTPANAPWVVAVAAAHHGRILEANRVVDVSGGLQVVDQFVGRGISDATPVLDIVYAGDFGNALCGVGEAELGPSCADNTGATSPFAPGTFDGQIVVCDRGIYGRVEKSKNVAEAGAAGMILANTASSPQSVVADQHCLPATHVDREAGDRLRDWLASGSNHRGRLAGTERYVDPELSGELAGFSSRGPAEGLEGLMKPNLTAPGSQVLAAGTEINEEGTGPASGANEARSLLSGTSMSSPHVAGAALLLLGAQPDWNVDVVVSALETTADPDRVRNAGSSGARIIDRGAGGVRVDEAARIGLFLPVTEQEFLDANPATGGDPSSLNLPGMVSENCLGTCVFTRTVRALGNGSWTVRGEGELDVRVTPSSFTLSEGQSRTLQIEVLRGQARPEQWAAGSVVLEPDSGSYSTQRLPVGARISAAALPDAQDFESDANRGRGEIAIPEVIALDELVFRASALVRPEQREVLLSQDSSREDPFDGPSGVATEFVEVPPGALLLHAETFASPASDVDLYVGRDDNGDGQAQGAELVCSSTLPDDVEVCDIESPRPGSWWVLVQNWESSGFGGNDIPFEFAVLEDADDPSLVVVGPGAHGGGPLTVPVYWDQPAMEQGDRWFGAVALATEPAETADIGIVPVTVTRTGDNAPAEVALFDGETYATVQPGSTTQDRMFIDVPPSAESVAVTVQGLVTDVTLRRRPFSALAASGTGTPPAPDAVLVEATQDGNTWTAQVGSAGQPPQPGRYYVVVENGNPAEVGVDVTAEVSTSAQLVTPPPLEENFPRRGLWGPEGRAINQGLDFQLGSGGRFAVWYTYDELGRPTFYITDTVAFDPTDPFFRAALFRPTSNDVRSNLEVVGEVQVTTIAEDRFMFAWRLNGHHGAELFEPVNGTTCPTLDATETPLLGHWFSPTTAAGGVTLLITGSSEAWIRYYYDDLNRPRWVLADPELESSTLPGGSLMEVLGFRGFCIYCEETEVTRAVIGTLERQFLDADTVREVSDFVARPGVDASVDIDRQLQRLSDPVSCSN